MLINATSKEHSLWSEEQLSAARDFGEIVDMMLPGVSPEADEAEVDRIAFLVVRRISGKLGNAGADRSENETGEELSGETKNGVLCQGDFTLVYRVVELLKKEGITVMAPTYKRVTKPTLRPDGTTIPGFTFSFVRFREY